MSGDHSTEVLWDDPAQPYIETWDGQPLTYGLANTLQGYLYAEASHPPPSTDVSPNEPPPEANPKNAYGLTKPPMHLVPKAALVQVAMVMRLGAEKYGAFNWRDSAVTASTYEGAAERHLASWFDGEGCDQESRMSHVAHAAACCLILLDAMSCGMFIDDRPTPAPTGDLIAAYTKKVAS